MADETVAALNGVLQVLRDFAESPLPEGDESPSAELLRQFQDSARGLPSDLPEPTSSDSVGMGERLDELERHIAELQGEREAAESLEPYPGELLPDEQFVAKTQTVIASGAAGNVKYAANLAGVLTEFGNAFSALNLGPSEIPSGAYVLLQHGEHAQPCFQYAINNTLTLADNTGVITSQTPAVGAATTGKRSDAADGLGLVGSPGDAAAVANMAADLEFVAGGNGLRIKCQRAAYDPTLTPLAFPVFVTLPNDGLTLRLAQRADNVGVIRPFAGGIGVPLASDADGGTGGAIVAWGGADTSDGLAINLDTTDPGLQILANKLSVKIKANSGAAKDADGVYVLVDDSTINFDATGHLQLKTAPVPAAHHLSHEIGGSDQINVSGLSGVLADRQDADRLYGNAVPAASAAGALCNDGFGNLSWSAPTPAGHHTTHEDEGSDEISLSGLRGVTVYVDHLGENSSLHGVVVDNAMVAAQYLNVGTTTLAAAQGDLAAGLTGAGQFWYDQSATRQFIYGSAGTAVVCTGLYTVAGYWGMFFGAAAASPAAGNYTLLSDGTLAILNAATGGSVYFRVNNATVFQYSATAIAIAAGIDVTAGSTNCDLGTTAAPFGNICGTTLYGTTLYVDHIKERTGAHTIVCDHVLEVPAGTAAAPGLRFTGDVDTGLYSVGADDLGIACAGKYAATFVTDGSVSTFSVFPTLGAADLAVSVESWYARPALRIKTNLDSNAAATIFFDNTSVSGSITGGRTMEWRYYYRLTGGGEIYPLAMQSELTATGAANANMTADLVLLVHASGDTNAYPAEGFRWTSEGVFHAPSILVDHIGEHTAAHKIIFDNDLSRAGTIYVDHLAEATGSHKVVFDATCSEASTTAHGLLKQLDNDPTHFLNGQGNWAAPAALAVGTTYLTDDKALGTGEETIISASAAAGTVATAQVVVSGVGVGTLRIYKDATLVSEMGVPGAGRYVLAPVNVSAGATTIYLKGEFAAGTTTILAESDKSTYLTVIG